MRQIEDARKKYEEIPIPQELSGRVRQPLSGQRKSGRVRSKKYQWPEYTEETISNLVDKIIDSQVTEGYFKECPITSRI